MSKSIIKRVGCVLSVTDSNKIHNINCLDICCIKYNKPYIDIITIDKEYKSINTCLRTIIEFLPPFMVNINQSEIANLLLADEIDLSKTNPKLKIRKTEYCISRRKIMEIKEKNMKLKDILSKEEICIFCKRPRTK